MYKDKFEARNLKKVSTFKYHNNDFEFSEEKVMSIGVITLKNDGKLVVVEIDRGFDILGGHVQ